jgi:hypothetical protein
MGLVRLFAPALVSVAISVPGAMPFSTQFSRAGKTDILCRVERDSAKVAVSRNQVEAHRLIDGSLPKFGDNGLVESIVG